MVDDDGRASIGDCASEEPAFRRIQPAIDASGSSDTVLVCPGVYTGQLTIGVDLTLAAAMPQRPTIRAPREMDATRDVLDVSGSESTIAGFRI